MGKALYLVLLAVAIALARLFPSSRLETGATAHFQTLQWWSFLQTAKC